MIDNTRKPLLHKLSRFSHIIKETTGKIKRMTRIYNVPNRSDKKDLLSFFDRNRIAGRKVVKTDEKKSHKF